MEHREGFTYPIEKGCVSMNNADKIRSMSDEELKKFICSMFKCEFCDFELGERCGLLMWLQQPAEEVDNETVGERKDGDGNG